MKITTTPLPGVLIFEPVIFGDNRGYFKETYQKHKYREAGILDEFVQDNQSWSIRNTVRGLHVQLEHTQGKLVQVVAGTIYDVAVDVRVGSPTFGKYVDVVLSDDNHKQFYIPPGYAHGFAVVSESSSFQYKCTDLYHPSSAVSIQWDDPEIGIPWPVQSPILSSTDRDALSLQDMYNLRRLPVCPS